VTADPLSAAPARHDLRLVPAALVGWAVVLSGLYLGSSVTAALGVAGLLVATAAASRGRSAVVVAVGGVAAAVALVVATHTWQVEHHPLRTAAQRGSAATLVVHLRDDPRAVASPGYGGRQTQVQQVVVHAELETATVAGQQWRAGGRVVLLAPARGWTGLLPGQRVRTSGLLAAPNRSDLTVAVLRARGGPDVLSAPTAVQRAAERLRSGLRHAARVLDPEPAGLLPALVVGDTSAMVPTVDTDGPVGTAGTSANCPVPLALAKTSASSLTWENRYRQRAVVDGGGHRSRPRGVPTEDRLQGARC
jgi:competence protein ComEC